MGRDIRRKFESFLVRRFPFPIASHPTQSSWPPVRGLPICLLHDSKGTTPLIDNFQGCREFLGSIEVLRPIFFEGSLPDYSEIRPFSLVSHTGVESCFLSGASDRTQNTPFLLKNTPLGAPQRKNSLNPTLPYPQRLFFCEMHLLQARVFLKQ